MQQVVQIAAREHSVRLELSKAVPPFLDIESTVPNLFPALFISLCRSNFPSSIIFLQPKEFSLTYHIVQRLKEKILSFCLKHLFHLWMTFSLVKWSDSHSVVSDPVTPWALYSPPGSSVHGILQARVLEWVAISFSRGSSWPRDWTQVSCIAGRLNRLSHEGSHRKYSLVSFFFLHFLDVIPLPFGSHIF